MLKATSLNALMKAHPEIPLAYKFIDGKIGRSDDRSIALPFYMAMLVL